MVKKIKKLLSAFDDQINYVITDDEENRYLKQYQNIVYKRCELLNQADDIISIEL